MFADTFSDVWEVVKFVVNHHTPLAVYREIARACDDKPFGGTELIKYAETRFASKLLMIMRYQNVSGLLEKLVVDDRYTAWVAKQTAETKERAAKVKATVRDDKLLTNIALCIKILEPCLTLLRLTDGKKGARLGTVYAKMLNLDVMYREPIAGLAERVRKKIHAIFMARWQYFHTPLMTAAYRFEPQYCRRDFDAAQLAEVRLVLKTMSTEAHPYPDLLAEFAEYEEALSVGSHDLTRALAFSERAQRMPAHQWAKVYMGPWPCLQFVAMRLLSLSCSASSCEHSWSIEGWIHSKKRNRLGQATVESLVRCHTNIILESNMEDEEKAAVLPWEDELEVGEPEEPSSEPETSRRRVVLLSDLSPVSEGESESEDE